jgi:hypothetical protein
VTRRARGRYGDRVAHITSQRTQATVPPAAPRATAPHATAPQAASATPAAARQATSAPQATAATPAPSRVPRVPPAAIPGLASIALHDVLRGPRRRGQVVAILPGVIYLHFRELTGEPRVIALSASGAICLPNAIALQLSPDGLAAATAASAGDPDDSWAGSGRVTACGLEVQVRRWWDPCPVVGPLSRARLEHGAAILGRAYAAADGRPGLDGHDGPGALAACCVAGDLAGAVELAESLVGLGPGLVPSGDSMISGLLLALRLLGGATAGGTRPVWLADWLAAAVTGYAEQRTTPLGATLLSCAARGQTAEEVSAVLRGLAGQEPLEPAARRLITLGGASGAELTWGLVAGCRAALALSGPEAR